MQANLVANVRTQTVVSTIGCADNTLTSDPSSILQEFSDYFGTLYDVALQEFLSPLNVSALTVEEAVLLDRAITIDEIEATINFFPAKNSGFRWYYRGMVQDVCGHNFT